MPVVRHIVRTMHEKKVPGVDAWTLHDDDGTMLGKLERKRLGKGLTVFWSAWGVHPVDGRLIPLELSADRDERVARILEFREHPERFRQHYK